LSVAVLRLFGVQFIIAAVTALYRWTALSYSIAWTDFNNLGNTHGYLIVVTCQALRASCCRMNSISPGVA
jgi:hypothetical protein